MSPPPPTVATTMEAVLGEIQTPTAPSLDQIEPGLFVGNWECIANPEVLRQNNIVAVLSVMNSWKHQPSWRDDHLMKECGMRAHLYIAAHDNSSQNLVVEFRKACAFIELWQGDDSPMNRQEGDGAQEHGADGKVPAVLIHCRMGMSRSATLAAAHLMYKHQISAHAAVSRVLAARPVYRASTFLDQLFVWQEVGEYDIWEVAEFNGSQVDGAGERVGQPLVGAGPDGQVRVLIPKQPYMDFLLRQARSQFLVQANYRITGRVSGTKHWWSGKKFRRT